MAQVPDIVRLSKLNAEFSLDPQFTKHVLESSRPGQRRVRQEERWTRQKELGRGAYGAVYLERCVHGNATGSVRAVKKIQRRGDNKYNRELEAIALFSRSKVSTAESLPNTAHS